MRWDDAETRAARDARIVELRREGRALNAISTEFGISVKTASQVCQRAGLGDVRAQPPPSKGAYPATVARDAKIVRLRDVEGLNFTAIARRLGCSPTTTAKAYAEAKRSAAG